MKTTYHYAILTAFAVAGMSLSTPAARAADEAKKQTNQASDTPKVKYRGISHGEVPKDVLKTMDEHTKGAKDLFYQHQLRDGKTFYSVHYNKDGKRMFIRVDDKGKLVLGPEVSDSKENKTAGSGTTSEPAPAGVKREAITTDDLPAPVRKTVEQTMANGGGHVFIRETKGNDVSYVIEYIVGEQRTSARVAPDGKVLQASPLAGSVPLAGAPPQPAPAATPAAPAPTPAPAQADADAQLAAQRDAAPYQILSGVDKLPAEARAAIEKETAGATDQLYQRFTRDGKTLYSAHFTAPNGRRSVMGVDAQGKVIAAPRKSNWQEGGKGVRFEVIETDRLPAEVRKQIEAQGGSEHLFLLRTEAGKPTYLVQYTESGERMESQFAENGKIIEKPRTARDQPFTIAARKGDKN